eukprot:8588243-Alexandrium_andersonii.AAC.1
MPRGCARRNAGATPHAAQWAAWPLPMLSVSNARTAPKKPGAHTACASRSAGATPYTAQWAARPLPARR